VARTTMKFVMILIAVLAVGRAECQQCAYEQCAYVSNEGSANVSVIDTASDKVLYTIKVGEKPAGIVASPDRSRLYLSSRTGVLVEHDLYDEKESARVALGKSPQAFSLSPDGKTLALAVKDDGVVALVNAATLAVVKKIPMRGRHPEQTLFTPDGRWIYASPEEGDSIDVIDVAKGTVAKSIKVGDRPRGIGFLPDSSRAYVAIDRADEVVAIDVSRQEVIARVKTAGGPNAVTVHPNGKRVFVSAGRAATVQVLDTTSNTIVAEAQVCERPGNMALTHDGGKLYVACGRDDELSVIDTSTNKRIARIPVGSLPSGVVITETSVPPRAQRW
jgi:YVTN family beta-propeller protein